MEKALNLLHLQGSKVKLVRVNNSEIKKNLKSVMMQVANIQRLGGKVCGLENLKMVRTNCGIVPVGDLYIRK